MNIDLINLCIIPFAITWFAWIIWEMFEDWRKPIEYKQDEGDENQ